MQNKRVWVNGVYRDATPKELEEMERLSAGLTENEYATEEDYQNVLRDLGVKV